MGLLRYLWIGKWGGNPYEFGWDLDTCFKYIKTLYKSEVLFGRLLGTMYSELAKENPADVDLHALKLFYRQKKRERLDAKQIYKYDDLDYCNYYILATLYSALELQNHPDKRVRDGATTAISKIMDAIIVNTDPEVAKIAIDFKQQLLADA